MQQQLFNNFQHSKSTKHFNANKIHKKQTVLNIYWEKCTKKDTLPQIKKAIFKNATNYLKNSKRNILIDINKYRISKIENRLYIKLCSKFQQMGKILKIALKIILR